MSLVDIEVGLTDQEREIVGTVHKFAAEVMRPLGVELDRLDDPNQVIASDSALWQMFEKYRELGLEELDSPDTGLSPVERARVRVMINEELGWGDSGLAVSLGVASMHRIFAMMSGNPELIERYCGPGKTEIGCWAITEPDHGSDTLGFNQPHFDDGALAGPTRRGLQQQPGGGAGAVLDRIEGLRDQHGLRGGERGSADLRRQRTQPRVSGGEAAARCPGRDDRGRLQ